MASRKKYGLERLLIACKASSAGIRAAIRHEGAFRQELLCCAVLIPLGLWLGQNGPEKALLAGSLLLVLVAELLNSAIEAVVDLVSPEQHELAGRAKDMAAAAVFSAIAAAVLVWAAILLA